MTNKEAIKLIDYYLYDKIDLIDGNTVAAFNKAIEALGAEADVCNDNRFEIIAKAKADLLEGTNIETDEAEMAVIDNILFRCWQMGWLDRYERKTENSSEKSNNCETCKHWDCLINADWECTLKECNYEPKDEPQKIYCPKCGRSDYIRDLKKDFGVKDSTFKYKCINCNTYIKDEPQTDYSANCYKCKKIKECKYPPFGSCEFEPKDEPQKGVSYSDHTDYDGPKTYVTWTEPKTEGE